jgi:hypothetical protein
LPDYLGGSVLVSVLSGPAVEKVATATGFSAGRKRKVIK